MNKVVLFLFIVGVLVLAGCSSSTIKDITTNDDHVDKEVVVRGTVQAPVKFIEVSGYTLVDKNGDKIIVGTSDLPHEGDKVVARGILKKGLFGVGYYIDSN